jgi:rhodanese-related sulfurtransferase
MIGSVSPQQLADRLAQGEALTLIDVRERSEWEICRLKDARLLPLSEMHLWAAHLAAQNEVLVIYCHHGIRSARVCNLLHQKGHPKVLNLAGGIDRWAREVTPALPRY